MTRLFNDALFWMMLAAMVPLSVWAAELSEKMVAEGPSAACESYGLPNEHSSIYHGDQVCDRKEYNSFKQRFNRNLKYKEMKQTQHINRVPNQKSVTCPLQVQDLKHEFQGQSDGYDTVWIVENTSSEPVILSFVKDDGIEYSAIHPTVTPPQSDPDAILYPRTFRGIRTFDGHVFHARTWDAEANALGPVVLQHRTGLIPVGQKFQELSCPAQDIEPLNDPNFQRTPPALDRPCNHMDIGFRNMANCPLHGYYIQSNATSCQEKFKFHLGMNTNPEDFMWGWDSATKFEGSFVGHSFAFRSAANPSILVETITLQPTRIIDCPELKRKVQTNKVTTVAMLQDVFASISDQGNLVDAKQDNYRLGENPSLIMALFNQTDAAAVANATTLSHRKRGGSPIHASSFVATQSF